MNYKITMCSGFWIIVVKLEDFFTTGPRSMKHLQTDRCSSTILGLQDVAAIWIHLLQSSFYSKMPNIDKEET